MAELILTRCYQKDCTIGILNHVDGFRCFTLELPWKDNKANKSCIPHGVYKCFVRNSIKNGYVFELENVPDRTSIQCHPANYTNQIAGCIAVGDAIKDINNDGIFDVTNSKKTHQKLMSILPEKFLLEIRNFPDVRVF